MPVRVATDAAAPRAGLADDLQQDRGGQIETILASGRRVGLMGPVDREALATVLSRLEGPSC